MAITNEHIAEVLRHHFGKAIGNTTPTCPICASTNWVIGGVHVTLPFDGAEIMSDAPVLPFVILMCRTCSNTLFIPWNRVEAAWKRETTYAR